MGGNWGVGNMLGGNWVPNWKDSDNKQKIRLLISYAIISIAIITYPLVWLYERLHGRKW